MKILLRTLPLTALLCTLGCDVEDESVARVGDGVVGVGLHTDDASEHDDFAAAPDPSLACSDAGWNASWATLEGQALTLINQKRAAGATCGGVSKPPVPALTLSTQLRCAARNHSKDMSVNNFFSHTGSNGSAFSQRITAAGYVWTAAAENIGAGYATAAAAVAGWMASTGHCNNIMSATYKDVGVGYAYKSTATYQHYWTTDFAKK